ncbi:MAG: TonB-dependent receptor [Niabella sp.]|nr:TonB-dependent receptor [Niabella sp.]
MYLNHRYRAGSIRRFGRIAAFLAFFLLIHQAVNAQLKVQGKVTMLDGTPLANVTVQKKNTMQAALSDGQGNYSLEVSGLNGELVFTHASYEPVTVLIDDRTKIDVVINEKVSSLNEVVVTGYGKQSRSNITTSVTKLDKKVLENIPYANAASALQGTVSGVRVQSTSGQPGAAPRIIVRGGTSIDNPNGAAPLYIIDGVVRMDMNYINPDDIESIQILKDAASTAIYGARGSNGVVIVTTRSGKAGKAKITYNYDLILSRPDRKYDLLTARDFIYFQRKGLEASGKKVPNNLAQLNQAVAAGTGNDLTNNTLFTTQYLTPANQHKLNEGWESMPDPLDPSKTIIFKNTDFQDILLKSSISHNHAINVSGGTEKSTFSLSGGYLNNEGIALNTDFKRITFNAFGDLAVNDKLKVFARVNYTYSGNHQVPRTDIFKRDIAAAPTTKYRFEDGTLAQGQFRSVGNPEYIMNTTVGKNVAENITFSTGAHWQLLPELSFDPQVSLLRQSQEGRNFFKAYYDGTTYNQTRTASGTYTKLMQPQVDAVLSYAKSFKEVHNLDAKAGFSYYSTINTSLGATGQGAVTDLIPTLNASALAVSVNGAETQTNLYGYFSNINYGFKRKYLLTINARYDGASNLGANNKWGFFPGVSAGWNVNNENFWKAASAVFNVLKLRASYGVNGNISGLSPYQAQGEYNVGAVYNGNGAIQNTVIPNQDLQWERSKTFDLGLDIGLLNSRITVIADVYRRVTDHLLTNLALPHSSGISSVRTNFGSMENKGFEAEGSFKLLAPSAALQWNLSVNASYVKNKILKLPYNGTPNNRVGGFYVWNAAVNDYAWMGGLQEGQSVGDLYAYKQTGIYATDEEAAKAPLDKLIATADKTKYGGDVNWADLDGNHIIDDRDRIFVGNIYPKWTGGISNSLSYKGVELYIRMDYTTGHTIYNETRARYLGQFSGQMNFSTEALRSWQKQGDVTDIPRIYWADQNVQTNLWRGNSHYYEKGDFLALREITLSYSLPARWTHQIKLNHIRFYASGSNLHYFSRFTGLNPEDGGSDDGRYPLPMNIVFGANITF